jgi:hypothetical protein
MANATAINRMLAQFAQARKPNEKKGWLCQPDQIARFDEVVKNITHLLKTGKGFAEAQEALFLFETGRGNFSCSLKAKAVEKHPEERDALLKRIDVFLIGMAQAVFSNQEFWLVKRWNFRDDAVALIKVVREEVKKEAEEKKSEVGDSREVMMGTEYSMAEPDGDE